VIVTPTGRDPMTPAEAYELVFAFNFKKYIEHDRFSGSGNLFVPRDVFAAVGGFRNGMSEDMDWCWRANALGYRLGYVADAVVRHTARPEWRELARKWDRVVAEHYLLARQRSGWWPRWLLRIMLIVASPFPHMLRVASSANLHGVRAKLAAVAGLFILRYYRAWQMVKYLMSGRMRNAASR
jgi:GT2 family glycosyltransferase